MIILSCDDVVKDNDRFGPKFSRNTNFEMIIAICPTNC